MSSVLRRKDSNRVSYRNSQGNRAAIERVHPQTNSELGAGRSDLFSQVKIEAKNVPLKKRVEKPGPDVLKLFDVERIQLIDIAHESTVEEGKLNLNRRGGATELLPGPSAEKARRRIPPHGHEQISVPRIPSRFRLHRPSKEQPVAFVLARAHLTRQQPLQPSQNKARKSFCSQCVEGWVSGIRRVIGCKSVGVPMSWVNTHIYKMFSVGVVP